MNNVIVTVFEYVISFFIGITFLFTIAYLAGF